MKRDVMDKYRLVVFAPSAVLLFGLFVWAMHDMVPFGHFHGAYGELLNRTSVYERHTTNVVTAVNFDYRAVDTLGEESILFMAVLGVAMLLRRSKQESKSDKQESRDESQRRSVPQPSDAVKTATMGLVGPMVVFGLYVVLHGQVTPGGGFQGGVILATAPLLVYLAGDFKSFKRIAAHGLLELAEALGIVGFVGVGLLGLIIGGCFLRNVLPLGTTASVLSSGTILALNICSALAVCGGFVVAIHAFLQQTLEMRMHGERSK
jgi:multicomponent Na+:H+ antiporter subunit B